LWSLGYPEAALADADHALKDAGEIGQAGSLMVALFVISLTHIFCGNYATATTLSDELVALADEKGAAFWKAYGMVLQGWLFALTGKASDAVQMVTSGITCISVNGSNTVDTVVSVIFGTGVCKAWSIR